MNIPGYDAWRMARPYGDESDIGEYDGAPCNRWQEPDEDFPEPRKCFGEMILKDGETVCDTCGERSEA